MPQHVQRLLTGIEGEAFGASAELLYCREHHSEFRRLDAERDALVHALIGASVRGDERMIRALAPRVWEADAACDAAVAAASARRERAHGHTKRIAGAVEQALVGRPLLQEVTP